MKYCNNKFCPVYEQFLEDAEPCKSCKHNIEDAKEQDASSEFVDWFEKILKGWVK